MNEQYFEILEKTNQQLGLWYAPANLAISVLSAYLVILGLIFTYILWRQGADYKKKSSEVLEKTENDAKAIRMNVETYLAQQKAIIEERNKQAAETATKMDELLNKYNVELGKASGQGKKEIEKAIKNLEKEKATLRATIGSTVIVEPDFNNKDNYFLQKCAPWNRTPKRHRCSSCGSEFSVKQTLDADMLVRPGFKSGTITCPFCGNVDPYFETGS